jgi:hypothetical protein
MDKKISDIVNIVSVMEDKIESDLDFLAGEIMGLQAKVARLEFNGRGKVDNKTREFDIRETVGYTEDLDDIDPNYPTTDELDNMDAFLSHYRGFVDKIEGLGLATSNIIALYAVYINTWRV